MPPQNPLEPDVFGPDDEGGQPPAAEVAALDPITKAEIDMQIATAKRYPRDIARVRKDLVAMATLDEQVAEGCFYSLKRKDGDGKANAIEGPSIRLAEMALACFGNVRAATRSLGETEDGKFIRALGVVHDVEKNVMVAREVTRRITNKYGKRYGDDMIGVTMAAASAIALRNATLTVVPRALVKPAFDAAREVALGKTKSLTVRRQEVVAQLQRLAPIMTVDRILGVVERRSIDELTWDDLKDLIGLKNSVRDGVISVEEAFPDPSAAAAGTPGPTSVGEILNSATAVAEAIQDGTLDIAARRGKLAAQGGARIDANPFDGEKYPAAHGAWLEGYRREMEVLSAATTSGGGDQQATDAPATAQPEQDPVAPKASGETVNGGTSLFEEIAGGGGEPPQQGGGRSARKTTR